MFLLMLWISNLREMSIINLYQNLTLKLEQISYLSIDARRLFDDAFHDCTHRSWLNAVQPIASLNGFAQHLR